MGAKQVSDLFLDLRKIPKGKDLARMLADEYVISQRLAEVLSDAKITGFKLGAVRHRAFFDDDPMRLELLEAGRQLLSQAERPGISKNSWGFDVWLNRAEQRDLVQQAWQENRERLQKRELGGRRNFSTWYQLLITSVPVSVVPPTKFGLEPFDEDFEGKYRCPFGHVAGLGVLSEVTLSRASWDGSDLAVTKEMVGVRGGVGRPHPILLASRKLRRLLTDHSVRGFEAEVAHLA